MAFFRAVSPPFLASSRGYKSSFLFPRTYMSSSITSVTKQQMGGQDIELLSAIEDRHGGVIVNMEEHMDSTVFVPSLKASISHWKQQGKKGVWIKLPLQLANLVEAAVKAGFRYHHDEPDYVMLVHWIPGTLDTLPANASHLVAIGAFVMKNNREVPVVQETNGIFRGTGVWKLPTGIVMEGQDISDAAIREVKEETGVSIINIWFSNSVFWTFLKAKASVILSEIKFVLCLHVTVTLLYHSDAGL